jgi:hypothetical protein
MAVTKKVGVRAVALLDSAVKGSEKLLELADAKLSRRMGGVEKEIYHAERDLTKDRNTVSGVPGVRRQNELVDRMIRIRRLNRNRKRVRMGMEMVEEAEGVARSVERRLDAMRRR